MKKFHLIFGAVVLVIFLLTGQYMDRFLQHLHGIPDGPRMLYRTRHIFILLSGLLHLGLGTYWRDRLTKQRRAIQIVGSIAISVASVLFVIGFFREPWMERLYAPYSKNGMILILAGTLLHFISGLGERAIEKDQS